MEEIKVIFRGHVQGVGFRFTVEEIAQTLSVSGYVKNEPDGSVLLVARGTSRALDQLLLGIRASRVGPMISGEHVQKVDGGGAYDGFKIRYG